MYLNKYYNQNNVILALYNSPIHKNQCGLEKMQQLYAEILSSGSDHTFCQLQIKYWSRPRLIYDLREWFPHINLFGRRWGPSAPGIWLDELGLCNCIDISTRNLFIVMWTVLQTSIIVFCWKRWISLCIFTSVLYLRYLIYIPNENSM